MRYLTKSLFKKALECPTKLFYAGKPAYLDNSVGDDFMTALAEGGHLVGQLARLMNPGESLVDVQDHDAALARTREWLDRDEVTIHEAALAADGLFVRVDILRKRGAVIELVEVKAASWRPDKGIRNSGGTIAAAFLPHLRDIAFQRHVAGLAYPGLAFTCSLMLVDTTRYASVDGLNQRVARSTLGQTAHDTLPPGATAELLGDPVLTEVPVDAEVAVILNGQLPFGDGPWLPFGQAVREMTTARAQDLRLGPFPGSACQACEFKAAAPPDALSPSSGFHECWRAAFGWSDSDFSGGTVLDLWNFTRKQLCIDGRVLKLSQVTLPVLDFDGSPPGGGGLSRKHRQWYQCHGGWPGGGSFYLDKPALDRERSQWRYPLHLIDFETSAAPIPFVRGKRPYETTAFQFSHHVLHEDGRLVHQSQFLHAHPAQDPNLAFLRALRAALQDDQGSVFRWADHENTVLLQLRRQLLAQQPAPADDAAELIAFIDTLVVRSTKEVHAIGARAMVDLCKLAELFYFHPSTRGSSSLKRVLPAVMQSAPRLRELYAQPVYGSAAMPSLNFTQPVVWWQQRGGEVLDPYSLLPPVFAGMDRATQAAMEAKFPSSLQEGGAAMAAYALLQSDDLSPAHRRATEQALLRYCELDTLAMAMVLQAWFDEPNGH